MYVHHGKNEFNTNLGLESLQEYFIITLDVFKENQHSKEKSTKMPGCRCSHQKQLMTWNVWSLNIHG